MTEVALNSDIRHKCLLVLVVLEAAVPELVLDDDFRPHLSHSQEIEERGLCPVLGRSGTGYETGTLM